MLNSQTIIMGQKIADIGILSIEAIAVVVRIMLDAVWKSVAKTVSQVELHTCNIYTSIDRGQH